MLNCSLIIAIVIGMCYIPPAAAKELLGAGGSSFYNQKFHKKTLNREGKNHESTP